MEHNSDNNTFYLTFRATCLQMINYLCTEQDSNITECDMSMVMEQIDAAFAIHLVLIEAHIEQIEIDKYITNFKIKKYQNIKIVNTFITN